MAFVQTYRKPVGSSGPTTNLQWYDETFVETEPWDAGDLVLTLTHNVAQPAGIFLVSQDSTVYPVDYTFLAPNQIQIDFGGDPAIYDGTWTFYVQYQYAT